MSGRVLRALCTLGLAGLAGVLGCTGSESQVFSQLPGTFPPVTTDEDAAMAMPAADGGGPDDEDAGSPRRNPGLDPDATFIWVETQPGHADACEPGTYSGSFECTFDEQGDFAHVLGSIEITLEPTDAGAGLTITRGRMRGFINGSTAAFSSALEGMLDCGSADFAASTTSSMTFALPTDWGQSFGPMTIDGSLAGEFDAEALTLSGNAELHTSGGWQCPGNFRAQLSR